MDQALATLAPPHTRYSLFIAALVLDQSGRLAAARWRREPKTRQAEPGVAPRCRSLQTAQTLPDTLQPPAYKQRLNDISQAS